MQESQPALNTLPTEDLLALRIVSSYAGNSLCPRLDTTPDERYARAEFFFVGRLLTSLCTACLSPRELSQRCMVRPRFRDRRRVRRGVSRSGCSGNGCERRHVLV